MNEVTILAPNEVVEQLEASERLPQDIDPDTLRKYGLAQQRYAKSHRILANCLGVKEFSAIPELPRRDLV